MSDLEVYHLLHLLERDCRRQGFELRRRLTGRLGHTVASCHFSGLCDDLLKRGFMHRCTHGVRPIRTEIVLASMMPDYLDYWLSASGEKFRTVLDLAHIEGALRRPPVGQIV